MTKVEALRELLGKVEAGTIQDHPHGGMPLFTAMYKHFGGFERPIIWHDANAMGAYHGSLDAAKALHDAVLPGWTWRIMGTGWCELFGPDGEGINGCAHNEPARAWLAAILKALIAIEEREDG